MRRWVNMACIPMLRGLYLDILSSCPHQHLWYNTPRIWSHTWFITIIPEYSHTHDDKWYDNHTYNSRRCMYMYTYTMHMSTVWLCEYCIFMTSRTTITMIMWLLFMYMLLCITMILTLVRSAYTIFICAYIYAVCGLHGVGYECTLRVKCFTVWCVQRVTCFASCAS